MRSICIVTESELKGTWERDFLLRSLLRHGVRPEEITWQSLPLGSEANVILALGERCLSQLTGKSGIDKWQCSVLFERGRKVIPCYDMKRVMQDLSLQVWVSLCCEKAVREADSADHKEVKRVFLLNPPLAETLDYLKDRARTAELLSVDIETGRGQINTVGFAVSPTEAIAINVLPDRLGAGPYHGLWSVIRDLLQSDQPKILQNFIYESQFFSRYGIQLRGVCHDTMIAQKFLWPEFEMGLDAVGRMYSKMSYWKEDGKSWNNIRDWERHYEYNCKDTTGTYEGYLGQRRDLELRGLIPLHDQYLRRLYPAVAEMCSRGIPVSADRLSVLRKETSSQIENELKGLKASPGAQELNPKSPAQVKNFLKGKGYAIPKKYDSATKSYKESTDEKSLKKLRLKYPEDESLTKLLNLSKLNKAQSSYLTFGYDNDLRMRYSLTAAGTETLRMAGHCDPWGNGVNPQTVPGGNKGINIKSAFECTQGLTLFAVDLRQAESRFVAYDSADLGLIQTLEDSTRDIHSEVACQILDTLGKPRSLMTDPKTKKFWRQLGKKSGHGANYSMKEATFMDSCIQEMDVVLTKPEAHGILEAYHLLFPGIRRWHHRIRQELAQQRCLKTPFGWERYFYGRLDDDMFRQAYAFRPQSTIPFITNKLMLHLCDLRESGQLDFGLLLQCHDSLLLECAPSQVITLTEACHKLNNWHPRITLSGGELWIPVECETGNNWGEMKACHPILKK